MVTPTAPAYRRGAWTSLVVRDVCYGMAFLYLTVRFMTLN
jgi:hypothetical protein